jgi:hypothetical protein
MKRKEKVDEKLLSEVASKTAITLDKFLLDAHTFNAFLRSEKRRLRNKKAQKSKISNMG